jgi:hypothetical protein
MHPEQPRNFLKPSKTARPADWGHDVTICIAGAVLDKFIVNISDRKIGLGDFASDQAAEKMDFIHRHWTAMIAGDDITSAVPIWRRMREKLGYVDGHVEAPSEKTAPEMINACVAAYREQRKEEIAAQFYLPHGLTEERFLSDGKRLLGLSLFTDLWNNIHQFKLQCTFLISGFDKDKQAHVFVIDDPGNCADYGTLGFWAIGSGSNEALSSIFFTLSNLEDFPQTLDGMIYDLCAAKFMAESNPHVGKPTNVVLRQFGQQPEFYPDKSIEAIRRLWKQGRPRRPKRTEETMKSLGKGMIVLNL